MKTKMLIFEELFDIGDKWSFDLENGNHYEGYPFELHEESFSFFLSGPLAPDEPVLIKIYDVDINSLYYYDEGQHHWVKMVGDIFRKDYQIEHNKLVCPKCGRDMSVLNVLQNSTMSWPNKNWIYLKCPTCTKYSHVEIVTGKISTGELDGAPGPIFYPCSEININELTVIKTHEAIECQYKGDKFVYMQAKI